MTAGVAEICLGIPVWEEKNLYKKNEFFQAFMVLR